MLLCQFFLCFQRFYRHAQKSAAVILFRVHLVIFVRFHCRRYHCSSTNRSCRPSLNHSVAAANYSRHALLFSSQMKHELQARHELWEDICLGPCAGCHLD